MNKLQKFAIWLDGFLQASDSSLNEEKTSIIKNKLNELFEHEAETFNTPEPNDNKFNNQTDLNPNQLYRC